MEANLILNKNKTIYHLGLNPEQIATTVLTVGDPARVSLISNHFDTIEFKNSSREFITHTGYLGNKRISVISTGIGTDNIDIVLNEIDALHNIDLETGRIKSHLTQLNILRIGTSASIRPEIPVDSFVLSKAAIGLDSLMHFYKRVKDPRESKIEEQVKSILPEIQSMYFANADENLIKLFSTPELIPGICLTLPGFYGPQGRFLRLKPVQMNFIDILSRIEFHEIGVVSNLEMETAGIYGLSSLLGHRSISLNAILANRILNEFSTHPEKTILRLIDKALDILIHKI